MTLYIILGILAAGSIGVLIYQLKSGAEAKRKNKNTRNLIKRRNQADKDKGNVKETEQTVTSNIKDADDYSNIKRNKLQNKPVRKSRK